MLDKKAGSIDIQVYPPEKQATGEFDGGRITEIKPIGFPGEGSAVSRIGPLFYWAWATSEGKGLIGLHPHKGFEIISYVLSGEIGHYDTLGTTSRVGAGGAQVMQTGSGVSHEEEILGERTDFFQIWFEPNLQEAYYRKPTYLEVTNDKFPVTVDDGVSVKTVIGGDSPVQLEVDTRMFDISIERGKGLSLNIESGRSLAMVTIEGDGMWKTPDGEEYEIHLRYFSVISVSEKTEINLRCVGENPLRVVIVDVPTNVDYPLYPK